MSLTPEQVARVRAKIENPEPRMAETRSCAERHIDRIAEDIEELRAAGFCGNLTPGERAKLILVLEDALSEINAEIAYEQSEEHAEMRREYGVDND